MELGTAAATDRRAIEDEPALVPLPLYGAPSSVQLRPPPCRQRSISPVSLPLRHPPSPVQLRRPPCRQRSILLVPVPLRRPPSPLKLKLGGLSYMSLGLALPAALSSCKSGRRRTPRYMHLRCSPASRELAATDQTTAQRSHEGLV